MNEDYKTDLVERYVYGQSDPDFTSLIGDCLADGIDDQEIFDLLNDIREGQY